MVESSFCGTSVCVYQLSWSSLSITLSCRWCINVLWVLCTRGVGLEHAVLYPCPQPQIQTNHPQLARAPFHLALLPLLIIHSTWGAFSSLSLFSKAFQPSNLISHNSNGSYFWSLTTFHSSNLSYHPVSVIWYLFFPARFYISWSYCFPRSALLIVGIQ